MKAAVTILLTAALGRAMPQAADEPKLPWVPQPPKKCFETWRSMIDLSTLQDAEQKCGTDDVCQTFGYNVSRDLLPEIVRKFGFENEAACLAAHEKPPKSPCEQAEDRFYDDSSTTPISRKEVDRACGEGYFCKLFDPEGLDTADIEFLTRVYSYKNEQECLDAHEEPPKSPCKQAEDRFYDDSSTTPLSREEVDQACGEGHFCELFDRERHNELSEFLTQLYSYKNDQECLNTHKEPFKSSCKQVLYRFADYSSRFPLSREEVDKACEQEGLFCELFNLKGLSEFLTQLYSYKNKQECLDAHDNAFSLKTRYTTSCGGKVNNNVTISQGSNGQCIDTSCDVGSLDIAVAGKCPDGQVRISYWQNKDCSGDWYGYGYGSRGTCRRLWSDGWNFQSLWVSCAKQADDCVSKGNCMPAPSPQQGVCRPNDVAFHVKTRYKTDCTGTTHDDVDVATGPGKCINTDCEVGSLDISDAGNCPDGEIRISYWEQANCGENGGRWFGYGYASRNTCRTLWSGGRNFKSLWMSCAKKSDDCVTKGQCLFASEPDQPIC